VAELDVADFMADHAAQFVVGHQVHQAAVDADAAIRRGERVDFRRLIDSEVQRQAIFVPETGSQGRQAPGIPAAVRRHFFALVELLHHAARTVDDVLVAQGRCTHQVFACAKHALQVNSERGACRQHGQGQNGGVNT